MSHVCTREINTKHVKTKTVDLGYRKIQVQLVLIGMRGDTFINMIFILLSERRHNDLFPVFKLSLDAILIDTAV